MASPVSDIKEAAICCTPSVLAELQASAASIPGAGLSLDGRASHGGCPLSLRDVVLM